VLAAARQLILVGGGAPQVKRNWRRRGTRGVVDAVL